MKVKNDQADAGAKLAADTIEAMREWFDTRTGCLTTVRVEIPMSKGNTIELVATPDGLVILANGEQVPMKAAQAIWGDR